MFYPHRLKFALELRGMSQKTLAEQMGLTTRQISNYLNGSTQPDIRQIADLLRLPTVFFEQEDEFPALHEKSVSFRGCSRIPKRLQAQAHCQANIAVKLNDWFEQEFHLQSADLPDYSGEDPEKVAEAVRAEWGLGSKPIGNLITLLEAKHIRVFSLSMETLSVDAYCTWHPHQENTPFVFLNTQKSAERSRFDAAHELGHLLCDKHSMKHITDTEDTEEDVKKTSDSPDPDEPRDIIERNANRFASAFLMPASAVFKYRHLPPSMENLMAIKAEFGVSLVALVRRMYDLGIISEWTYGRVILPKIARMGYRTQEPKPMAREHSGALRQIFSILKEDNIGIKEIAQQIHVGYTDVAGLTFHLVDNSFNKYNYLRQIK